ncbi:histidine phosphatase family protein [Streptomyces sp. P9(2023)]|uniref:histidine phosphatase family protein n=1 Tax=Streptomyces sp. P9(2023) TaxID=3064394 RepID=UPI0028F420FD|nr:histidine phosphatase family protein [Streptomyces sp. P9(2023)]MDT9693591.1 histidine phosphatase family protein [Streptomyces sp. P9(2023)]
MTVRLTLLCAPAAAERDVRFGEAPLDERALRQAGEVAALLPRASLHYSAPSDRCENTVRALRWDVVTVELALRDMNMGRWAGRTLGEVAEREGDGLAAWMSDPEAAPHGGESVSQVCDRVAVWLDGLPTDAGRVLAVADQSVVRAAVVSALGTPRALFWRIDVPPLAAVHLTGRNGRWNLRLGALSAVPDWEES